MVVLAVIAAVLLLACITLSLILLAYRKYLKKIERQIDFIAENDTNGEISAEMPFRSIKALSAAINRLIAAQKNYRIERNRADKVFKESITGISHDLRTPLTSAAGYVQMISSDNLPEDKRKEYIGIIGDRISSVRKMLDQLFEYARIEGGEMKLEIVTFNMNNILRDKLSLFFDDFCEKGIEPIIEIPDTPFNVDGDINAMGRVVQNIISNALRYGEGYFSVKSEADGEYCRVTFSNRTELITAEDVDKIFDRFYTSDKSRSKKSTGLGLSIAKRFVNLMGGKISSQYEGDIFSIVVEMRMK